MAVAELGVNRPRFGTRVERRVCAVIAAEIAVGLVFAAVARVIDAPIGSPTRIVLLTIAFAVAGSFDMSLELRRHNFTFTLADSVLAIGFFVVGPIGLGAAAALGEAIDNTAQRRGLLKGGFNVGNRLAAATAAGVAFTAAGNGDVHDAIAWAVALGAAVLFSVIDVVSTATVLSIVEQTRFRDVLARSASTGVLATLAAAPIGLVTIDLAMRGPLMPLILVPLAVAVALNSRYAIAQRDEHWRFERLYQSLSRTAGVSVLDDALGALAVEARGLGTGGAALCCAIGLDGNWTGAIARDASYAAASADAVAAAVALADRSSGSEIDVADAPELLTVARDAKSGVVVSSAHENARRVVLVVVRDSCANPAVKSRVETLDAFAHQAALVASNAILHEERAIALARQIDLNRQKSDFVAAVSHELRTPLGVMLGSVHTLERLQGRISDAQREQLFDMAIDQGGRLQRLIDELLLVAAAEHSSVPLDAARIDLDELFAAIDTDVSAPVRAQLRYAGDGGELVSDSSKIQRILLNLVENAGKYAPGSTIELTATRHADRVDISVVDHGPGIPAEDRDRVFERFVQLDQSSTRRQGGTGLGLHLCRQLTALLEGELRLDATPGGGCTFTLTLPLCLGAAEAPASDAVDNTPSPVPAFAGLRVRPDALGSLSRHPVP